MTTTSGVGVMGYGDKEYMAHRATCLMCQSTNGYMNGTAYRPHTGDEPVGVCSVRYSSAVKSTEITGRGLTGLSTSDNV